MLCTPLRIGYIVGLEAPLVSREDLSISTCSCEAEKLKSRLAASDSEPGKNEIKLNPHTLNDALCISLDSIWFLSAKQELYGITGLIKKIIANGAYDFTRAALRTSFLTSRVSACQSRTMSLADTVTVMAQRGQHPNVGHGQSLSRKGKEKKGRMGGKDGEKDCLVK
ncbi:unnamed protein product [Fraxinus pennsylvanica]|uniref:Uncharacterized protein n=1 Tax=Fraxinus pennsylvanica TaxID=56036 RepID=A0AAD1ZKU2_9LAMI|nr:unnamed protein product [Fraxinus pennsylvanica]